MRRGVWVLAVGMIVGLTACGGSGSESGQATPSASDRCAAAQSAVKEYVATATATGSATASEKAARANAAVLALQVISDNDTCFSPGEVATARQGLKKIGK